MPRITLLQLDCCALQEHEELTAETLRSQRFRREEPDSFTPSDATRGGVAAVNAQTATVATRRRPGERYDWPGSMRPKMARRDEAFGMRTKSGDESPHSKKRTIAGGKFSGMVRIPTSDAQMHSSISTTLPVSERDGKTAS